MTLPFRDNRVCCCESHLEHSQEPWRGERLALPATRSRFLGLVADDFCADDTVMVEASNGTPVGPWGFLTKRTPGLNGQLGWMGADDAPAARQDFHTITP